MAIYSVYESRTCVGSVELVGKKYLARDLNDDIIGRFASLQEALASFDGEKVQIGTAFKREPAS
jgi:hypothetical protein